MNPRSTVFLLSLVACAHKPEVAPVPVIAEPPAPPPRANPLMTASTLPLAYPPFDQIQDADFRPGFLAGMAEQVKETKP